MRNLLRECTLDAAWTGPHLPPGSTLGGSRFGWSRVEGCKVTATMPQSLGREPTKDERARADAWYDALAPFIIKMKYAPAEYPTKEDYTAFCPLCETPGESNSPSAEICLWDGGKDKGYMWACNSEKEYDDAGKKINHDVDLPTMIRRMKARKDYAQIAGENVTSLKDRSRVKPKVRRITPIMHQWEASMCTLALLKRKDLIEHLAKTRGLTLDSIVMFGIGWLDSRKAFTIPVYGREKVKRGELSEPVNVKLALHPPQKINGKTSKYAWFSAGIMEKPLLFGDVIQPGDDVLVVEGEWDAILARQLGFNAVSATRGAKKWEQADTDILAGCHVTVLMDNDKAGQEGAALIERSIKRSKSALTLRIVKHDVTGADFCDLVVKHGWGHGEFRALIDDVERIPVIKDDNLPKEGKRIPFNLLDSRNSNKEIIESTVMVDARLEPKRLPWRGLINCSMDYKTKKVCTDYCPLGRDHAKAEGAEMALKIDRTERDHFMPMLDVDDKKLHEHLRKIHDLKCSKFEVDRTEDIDVEHLIISAPLLGAIESSDETLQTTSKMMTMYLIGSHDTEPGSVLRIVGKSEADAKKQDAVVMAWYAEDDNPLRERKVLSEVEMEMLRSFQTPDDVTPFTHLLSIAESVNAQYGIVGREVLGAAFMLTHLSVLDFYFKDQKEHGWIQGVVVGDARTGKSKTAEAYVRHFGYGTVIKCDVSSRAGLAGGQVTHPFKFIKMGLLPRSDGRMVYLDEATNLLTRGEVMKELVDMRSSGTVEINLVNSKKFNARLRQVWMSNPPGSDDIENIPARGIQAIRSLYVTDQSIQRFDWAYAISRDMELGRRINASRAGKKSPYTTNMFKTIIEWIWTRRPDDIKFDEGVEEYIGRVADRIATRYHNRTYDIFTSISSGSKVARMAVAFAACQASTLDGINVIVTVEHVDAVEEFLKALFDDPALGLGSWAHREISKNALAEKEIDWFRTRIDEERDYHNAAVTLIDLPKKFSLRMWRDNAEASSIADPIQLLLVLQNKSLIAGADGEYTLTEPFRKLLRTLADEGVIGTLRI